MWRTTIEVNHGIPNSICHVWLLDSMWCGQKSDTNDALKLCRLSEENVVQDKFSLLLLGFFLRLPLPQEIVQPSALSYRFDLRLLWNVSKGSESVSVISRCTTSRIHGACDDMECHDVVRRRISQLKN